MIYLILRLARFVMLYDDVARVRSESRRLRIESP